jgi:hypothetical protein
MADYNYEEKEDFEGKKVRVLGTTYEPGAAKGKDDWTGKLGSADERLGYLRTALRYWYSNDWFGSEKRKQEA